MNAQHVLLLALALSSGQGIPAELSKDQIIVGLTQRRTQLERVRIRYIKSKLEPGAGLLRQREFTVARDGQKRFSDALFLRPDGSSQHLVAAYDGVRSKRLEYAGRHGLIQPGKDELSDAYDMIFPMFRVPLGDPAYVDAADPQSEFFLPEGVQHERYVVLPHQEMAGNRLAHVISVADTSKSFYKTWIDTKQDFAVLKWEYWTGGGRIVVQRVELEGHAPAGERVMPRRIVYQQYDTKKQGKPQRVIVYDIEDIFVGRIPRETFDVVFPPGTWVVNKVRNTTYQVPGSSKVEFDDLSADAKRQIIAFQRSMERPPWHETGWFRWTLRCLVLMLLGATLWWFVMRRRWKGG